MYSLLRFFGLKFFTKQYFKPEWILICYRETSWENVNYSKNKEYWSLFIFQFRYCRSSLFRWLWKHWRNHSDWCKCSLLVHKLIFTTFRKIMGHNNSLYSNLLCIWIIHTWGYIIFREYHTVWNWHKYCLKAVEVTDIAQLFGKFQTQPRFIRHKI